MNSQHTPGPWEARQIKSQSDFSRFYVWQIVAEKTEVGATLICTFPDYPIKSAEADARLISAAPDLLKACQMALEDESTASEVEAICQAAIAKAKGQL